MSVSPSTHERALRLQKKIFNSLKAEADLLLGKTPESIRRYEKENRGDFKLNVNRISVATKPDLLEAVRETDVTFIADFHTFDQAQRTALRIMREAIQPNESWLVGLELIPSQFQRALDEFQAGNLSLESFHELISYRDEWGFAWKNYFPIFEWAKENGVRLIALNRPKAFFRAPEERELHERDQWAAGIITDIFYNEVQRSRRPKMIVLYGELHVGTKHLPHQLTKISRSFLRKSLSWVAIHQNDDRLYWKLAQQDRELHTQAVKLKKNVFCVFSSTPWAKLQSLVSWIEGGTSDAAEGEQDYLSILFTYGTAVSEFLGVHPPSFEAMNACTINQTDFLEKLSRNDSFTSQEIRLIQFHVTHNQRIYIPRVEIAYLGSPSYNAAAELAAVHLLRTQNRSQDLYTFQEDDFYRLVLEAAFGFFGSLILNHRRKCDLPKDHIKRLRDLRNNEKPTFPLEREAREIAMGVMRNRPYPNLDIKTVVTKKSLAPAVMLGARFLGRILGKRLHQAILAETVAIETIRKIFFSSSDQSTSFFYERYRELVQVISPVPTSPSKTDHL